MKFKIVDVRGNDTQLRKGAIASKPDHIQQQLINFVSSHYKGIIELKSAIKPPTPKTIRNVMLQEFLSTRQNLRHMSGILHNTLYRYYNFTPIQESETTPTEVSNQNKDKAEHVQLTFKDFFNNSGGL